MYVLTMLSLVYMEVTFIEGDIRGLILLAQLNMIIWGAAYDTILNTVPTEMDILWTVYYIP